VQRLLASGSWSSEASPFCCWSCAGLPPACGPATLWTGLALGVGLFTDRASYVLDGQPDNGVGDFYGATLGLELSNEHWLAAEERAESLVFRSVFALRYAFSDGHMDDFVFDPNVEPEAATGAASGAFFAHEIGLYVGGGLEF